MLFEERGNDSSPSLRRHYPDQVYGYYLSRLLRASTPGTLKLTSLGCKNCRKNNGN
jgi:hypothetical protein